VSEHFIYEFEWDAKKAKQNAKRHGVVFERAAAIFLDPLALSQFDAEHSETEDRWITLGLDQSGVVLVVCHTFREETELRARIRIISARKATKNEIKAYKEK
jgi:uncharacterized DUF497 family protein